jgi:diguanylate cyclase (GGDEF)-like protein
MERGGAYPDCAHSGPCSPLLTPCRGSTVTATRSSVLIVDDEPYILHALTVLLTPEFEVLTTESADAAQEVLSQRSVDIILSDQRMPRKTGVELLEWVRLHHPRTVRVLMTGFAELEHAVAAINRGQVYHYLLKPWRGEEVLQILRNAAEKAHLERNRDDLLEQLRRLNLELEQRVEERTQDLERANRELEKANRELQQQAEELKRLALTDPLTGLFNRRAMDGLALAELKRHARYHNPLTFGLIDVDHFKNINTQYLYTGGDAVLVGLARILTSSVREVVDSVGRIGGEEFLIIARETDTSGALVLAERLRLAVADTPIVYQDQEVHVTISLGFAVAEGDAVTDYQALYTLAAEALSMAKKTGRNRSVVQRLTGNGPESPIHVNPNPAHA